MVVVNIKTMAKLARIAKDNIPILACRVVELTSEELSLIEAELAANMRIAYTGSTKDVCEACNREVWVGPNQLAGRAETAVHTICMFCAARTTRLLQEGRPIEIVDLGNTEFDDQLG